MNNTCAISYKDLEELLMTGFVCTIPSVRTLCVEARRKMILRATDSNNNFSLAKYKEMLERYSIVLPDDEGYTEVNEAFQNFNPLADYNFEFLAAAGAGYAVLWKREQGGTQNDEV